MGQSPAPLTGYVGQIPRVGGKEIWQGGALELDDAFILAGDALMQQKKFRQLFFAISCMLDTSLAGDRWGTAERWGGGGALHAFGKFEISHKKSR